MFLNLNKDANKLKGIDKQINHPPRGRTMLERPRKTEDLTAIEGFFSPMQITRKQFDFSNMIQKHQLSTLSNCNEQTSPIIKSRAINNNAPLQTLI